MSDTVTKVEMLLKGSRRINEMKEEIDSFVSIMRGFIKSEYVKNDLENILHIKLLATTFTETGVDELYWCIDGPETIGTGNTILLKEFVRSGRQAFIRGGHSQSYRADELPLNLIKYVYQSLPELLDVLIKSFPILKERIAPLLEASKL